MFGEKPTARTPKIFGVGLSRTGTTSLANAFRQIGLKVIHFDPNIIFPFLRGPNHSNFNYTGVYDDVDAVFDLPSAFLYQELLQVYPHAKFVSSFRDPVSWFSSFSTYLQSMGFLIGSFTRRMHAQVYGSEEPDAALWIKNFREHYLKVSTLIPATQLFSFDVLNAPADIMQQLCHFVGVTCENKSFPHANRRQDHEFVKKSFEHHILTSQMDNVQPPRSKFAYVTLVAHLSSGGAFKNAFLMASMVFCQSVRESYNASEFESLVYFWL